MSAPVPFLRLEDLSKRFGATLAVDHVSLALERGEILALLGPSGSGKTTTLRLLAGFEVPDSGRVLVEQDDVTAVAPVARRQRQMGRAAFMERATESCAPPFR